MSTMRCQRPMRTSTVRGAMNTANAPDDGSTVPPPPPVLPNGSGCVSGAATSCNTGCLAAVGVVFLLAGIAMFVLYGQAELDQACQPDPYSTGFCGADSFVLGLAWVLVVIGILSLVVRVIALRAKGELPPS